MEKDIVNTTDSKNSLSNLSYQEKLKKYNINQKSALFTILLCIFTDGLGFSMILPLLPVVATKNFGATNFLVGILIASNALSTFIFAPIWGKLSDKIGRRIPLLISQLGTLISFLILGFSDSITIIFVSRILDGMFGGQIPIIRAYITDVTDTKTRSVKMGYFTAGMAFGMIFGPSLGGLIGTINWRYPAFIASALSIVSMFLTISILVESMPKERRLEIKQRRLQNNENRGETKFMVLTKVVVLRLFEILLIAIAFSMIFSTFALVMNLRYGLDVALIGIFSTFAGICMIVVSGGLIKPLNKKFGEKTMLLFSLGMAIAVFLSYPFLYEAWLLFIYIVPFMFMDIFIRTIVFSNLSKGVEEDHQGVVSGWASNMFSIGQIVAPLIGYWYLDIGTLMVFGVTADAYFLMGITCTLAIFALSIIALYDMRKYPGHFEGKEIIDLKLS